MQRVRLRRTALRATPRMNTSTQPPEGAGGSRSRAAGELTLGLMSGEERGGAPCFSVGAGLSGRRIAAMAACQTTNHLQMCPIPCGSWLVGAPHRSDGGLPADQSLADVPNPLWELACRGAASQRWRPASRPITCRCAQSPVGAGLSGRRIAAMAACQPTNHLQMCPIPCGSWPVGAPHRSDGGLPSTNHLQMCPIPCGS